MKICILAPEFLPIIGGVGTHIVELIRHLPSDIEICVLTLKRKSPNPNIDVDYLLSEDNIKRSFKRDIDLRIVTEAKDEFIYNAKFQLACYKWVQKLYKEDEIDLFHSHFGHMPDLILKLRNLDIPIVTTAHLTNAGLAQSIRQSEVKFKDLETAGKYSIILSPLLKNIEKIYLRRSKNIIAVSNWMTNILTGDYNIPERSIKMIPNGVDTEKYRPNIQNDTLNEIDGPIVLFTGRLTSTKGIGYLVDAIPKVLKEQENVHFVFVGGGNPEIYLEQIKKLNISSKNYSFLGYVKDDENMAALYSRASVYVVPSLFENLPIRILEAMSSGIPTIASNVCAIPEAITDGVNGFLIPPKNPDILSQKIIQLIKNEDLSKRIGLEARNTAVSKFNWKDIGITTSEHYRSIIGKI